MKKRIVIVLIVFVILGLAIGLLIRCSGPSAKNPDRNYPWAESTAQQIDQIAQITLSYFLKQGEESPIESIEPDTERLRAATSPAPFWGGVWRGCIPDRYPGPDDGKHFFLFDTPELKIV